MKERRGRDVIGAIKGITTERIAPGTDLGLQLDIAKGGRNAAGGVGKEILLEQDGKVLFKGDISAYLPTLDIVHAKLWLCWGAVEIFEIISFIHGFQTRSTWYYVKYLPLSSSSGCTTPISNAGIRMKLLKTKTTLLR